MPSSVARSMRMSGHSVMVAMRATTGRLSLRRTGRAVMLLNVSFSKAIPPLRQFVSLSSGLVGDRPTSSSRALGEIRGERGQQQRVEPGHHEAGEEGQRRRLAEKDAEIEEEGRYDEDGARRDRPAYRRRGEGEGETDDDRLERARQQIVAIGNAQLERAVGEAGDAGAGNGGEECRLKPLGRRLIRHFAPPRPPPAAG